MKPSKRYDTVFYTAAISESVDLIKEDNEEVTEIEVRSKISENIFTLSLFLTSGEKVRII